MTEEEIKKLEFIKQNITDGTYCILQKPQWDKFGYDLSNIGSNLLKNIEQIRNDARKLKTTFFRGRKELDRLSLTYDEVAKNFDLFFDSSLKWLRSITDKNKYEEYEVLLRKGIEGLVEHCRQAIDYLGNIISFKRNDYWQYRNLSWIKAAGVTAIITLIIVIINLLIVITK